MITLYVKYINIIDIVKINRADSRTRNSSILLSLDIVDLWLINIKKDETINTTAQIKSRLKRQLVRIPWVILLNIYIIKYNLVFLIMRVVKDD